MEPRFELLFTTDALSEGLTGFHAFESTHLSLDCSKLGRRA